MDTPPAHVEEETISSPASRRMAIAAFLLAVTSLLLAWWRVTWTSGGPPIQDDVRLFRPEEPLTTVWGPWVTGALVVVALAILFVRIAAKSDRHEPPAWRRDLGLAAGVLGAALVSCLFWPAGIPAFWGGRTLTNKTITDGAATIHEVAMPGLGWWTVVAAMVLLLAARWRAK